MTINFPISNKERNISIFLYETLISVIIIFLLSFSVVLSLVLVHKLDFIDVIIVNLLFVSSLLYLTLQVISKCISIFAHYLKISKFYHVINLSFLVLIFTVIFNETQKLVPSLATDFIQGSNETNSALLFLQQFHQEYGFIITTILYIVLALSLLSLIIVLPDNSYMANSKNIHLLHKIKKISILKTYILSGIRKTETINTTALMFLATLIMIIFQMSEYMMYTMLIAVFNSIYGFINSQQLRQIMYKFNYNAWKDYAYLIFSQLITIYLLSLPLLIAGLIIIDDYTHILIPYGLITFGVLMIVMAGILFPPYNDNPFSVITSAIVVIVPIFVLGLSLTILNLGVGWNIGILIFTYIVIVEFSIQGLKNIHRRVRIE